MSGVGYAALRITTIVVVAYIGLCLLVYFRQASYVYYPARSVGLTPAYFKLDYDEVRVKTDDGVNISGWFVRRGENWKQKRTVLLCHGNAGNIADRLDHIVGFINRDMNVFVFDYRGYGDSEGAPSEDGTYRDAMACWKYLTETREIPAGNIILYGESLGGAVAAWLAEHAEPAVIVLDSTFTSAPAMGAGMFPFLPVKLLCTLKYDTLARLPTVTCPVVVAHSRNDEMIPFRHGKQLFESARDPKLFVEMKGMHNDGGVFSDSAHMDAVVSFIDTNAGSKGSR